MLEMLMPFGLESTEWCCQVVVVVYLLDEVWVWNHCCFGSLILFLGCKLA